ncbi:MAG: DUF167 domain-containing protein [Kiritimatiellia bacterium]|nr:DUF167 domain-containing protein [Lentisphaerota bacterium]
MARNKAAGHATTVIKVHAVPRAVANALCGWHADALKVRLRAPPAEGRANRELCAFLSEKLALPVARVRLMVGAGSRQKLVAVDGLTDSEVWRRLGQGCPPA